MQILGFNKTTLLDYPGHLASTIFLSGCNYRCPFCHNSSLLFGVNEEDKKNIIPKSDILAYLTKRRNIIEGVCITGGEPTIHEELVDFIKEIKNINLKVKLDTNGTNPSMLSALLSQQLIDYVAMDIKNSIEHYSKSIGFSHYDTKLIEDSIFLLKNSNLPYEFRTTLVKEHHTIEDIHSIGRLLQGDSNYYLQNFRPSSNTLKQGLHSLTKDTLIKYCHVLKTYLPNVTIRGID